MPRFYIALLVGLTALAACISFDLDDRRYRCGSDDSVCGEGMTCAASGYCEVAGASDANVPQVDAAPDICAGCEGIECESINCGVGCQCMSGVSTEIACGDGQDNDGDGFIDCLDSDCTACTGNLMCCSDGACRLSC